MDTEERIARIEDSLAKAHRTGIETGAAMVAIMRIICDAIPAAKPGVERGLRTAIDAATKNDRPVTRTVLEGALAALRQPADRDRA